MRIGGGVNRAVSGAAGKGIIAPLWDTLLGIGVLIYTDCSQRIHL